MNVEEFLKTGPVKTIPNPNYKPKSKKNTEPPTIQVIDYNKNQNRAVDFATKGTQEGWSMSTDESDKLRRYGSTPAPFVNIQKELADAQSNWAKFGGFLAQTLSELTLGTVQAGVDIFDYVASNIFHLAEDNYQSALGNKLEQAQDYIRDTAAPIYYNTDAHIGSGGMKDFGWWCSNATSIVSSLTLLLPSTVIIKGIGWVGKALKADKAFTKVAKWAVGVNDATKVKDFGVMRQALFSTTGQARIKGGAELLSNAWLMRTMENYQEARDTYKQVYDMAAEKLYGMSQEEYSNWIETNRDEFDKDININSRDEVAKNIAKRGADRTFAMDFSNIIFDIIQLHGLKSVGVIGKNVSNATKNKLLREGIEQLTKDAITETAETATKQIGRWAKAKAFAKDFVKASGLTTLEESTEGIEEAVNYIAQQEGITYGKALLEGMSDDYSPITTPVLKRFAMPINALRTWTNLQNPFRDYIRNGELLDSAFWGVLGGVVFTAGGNGFNQIRSNVQTKRLKKQLKEKGLDVDNTPGLDTSWMNIFDTYETKAARTAMQNTIASINQLSSDLKLINQGKNVLAEKNEAGEFVEFESEAEKEITKQNVLDAFIADIALNAINSGTFDMLVEYFNAKEVKDAMVNLGINSKETIDSDTQQTIQQLEKVKDIYTRQSAFVNAQITQINATKNSDFDENISFVYAQAIAKENTEAILMNEDLEKQKTILNNTAERLKQTVLENKTPDEQSQLLATFDEQQANVKLTALMDAYTRLSADEKFVENLTGIPEYEKQSKLTEIRRNKKLVADEIKEFKINDMELGLPAMFLAERKARTHFRQDGKYYKKAINPENPEQAEEAEKIDKEIINSSEIQELNTELVDDDVIINSVKQLESRIDKVIGVADNNGNLKVEGFAQQHPTIFNNYMQIANIDIQQRFNSSRMATSISSINDKVHLLNARLNSATKGAIKLAEKIIIKLYTKYNKTEDAETRTQIIEAIFAAHLKDKTSARRIAEEVLTPSEVEELLDAFDVFTSSIAANEQIYAYFLSIIRKAEFDILQGKLAEETSIDDEEDSNDAINATEENANLANNGSTSESSAETTNSSSASQSFNTEPGNAQNQEDIRPKRTVHFNFNRKKGATSFRFSKDSVSHNATNFVEARVNPDGTIELMFDKANPITQHKVIGTLFNSEDEFSIDDKNQTWQIDSNPIFVLRGDKLELKELGYISKIEGTLDDVTPPVENNTPSNSESSESEKSSVDNNDNPFVSASAPEIVTETTEEKEEDNAVVDETSNEASPSETTSEMSSTGGEESTVPVQASDLDSAISEYVADRTYTYIRNANINIGNLNEEIDFEALANEIFASIKEENKNNNIESKITDEKLKELIASKLKPIEQTRIMMRANMNTGVANAAVPLAMSSRVIEQLDPYYEKAKELKENQMNIFSCTAKYLFDSYIEITDIKNVDGKKIIVLEQILGVAAKIFPDATVEQIRIMNDMLKAYINTLENVELVDNNDAVQKVIDSFTNKNIIKAKTESLRVNLDIFVKDEHYWSALDSISKGDVLQCKFDKVFNIYKNGVKIGELNGATYNETTGEYEKTNSGWHHKLVKRNGKIEGDIVDVIKEIFLSNRQDCNDVRNFLSTILTKLKTPEEENAYINLHINYFASLPYIQGLIQQSVDNAKNNNNLLFAKVDKFNNSVYVDDNTIKRAIIYLKNLWNYTAFDNAYLIGVTNQQDYLNKISNSIDDWFETLYNTYDFLENMPKDNTTDVTVSNITDGGLIFNYKQDTSIDETPESDMDDRYEYTSIKDSIVPECKPTIGVVKTLNNVKYITLSNSKGRVSLTDRSSDAFNLRNPKPGYVIINLTGPTGKNYYTYGRAVHGSSFLDDRNKNGLIGKAIQAYINKVLNKDTLDITEIEKLFRDLFPSIGKYQNETCPLFRKDPKGALNGNYLYMVGDSTDKNTGAINGFTFKCAYANGNIANIRIYNSRTSTSNTLSMKINNQTVIGIDEIKKYIRQVIEGAIHNSIINIDEKACKLDGAKSNFSFGHIVIDDKVKFKLGDVEQEYDSYNDFIIENDLVGSPLAKNPDGRQFTRHMNGKKQTSNQVLMIDLPTSAKPNITLEGNEYLTDDVFASDYAKTKSIMPSVTDADALAREKEKDSEIGIALAQQILGSDFDELDKIAKETGLTIKDLFPKRIAYDNRLNSYFTNKRGNVDFTGWGGSIAYARNGAATTYRIVNADGTTSSVWMPVNTNVVVGPLFLNIASSNYRNYRQEAVRKLIHEQVHQYLREHALTIDIVDIFNEFDNFVQEDLKNGVLTDKSYVVAALKDYRGERLIEEFLVESLTSKQFYNYLNSKTVEVDNNTDKEDNFFIKVIKAIAKFFGWNKVRDNSLLMKELNALRNAISNDSNKTIFANIDKLRKNDKFADDTTKQDETATVANTDLDEETNISNDVVTNDKTESNESNDEHDTLSDELGITSSDNTDSDLLDGLDIDDTDFDTDAYNASMLETTNDELDTESVAIVNVSTAKLENLEPFKAGLSSKESIKFDDLCDTGEIQTSCKIV